MNFIEAEQYIAHLEKFGIRLGLENIGKLLDVLGSPHESLKFVHVGGTNGKGSTSHMLAKILQDAGYRVGLYTSPHIHTYRERISINGRIILENDFANIVKNISLASEQMEEKPTEFEFLTALAFEYFLSKKVDIASVEVGMGGRLDATNIIPSSEVSIITNISRDHMEHLGSHIKDIAHEKAGIIKGKGTLITTEKDPQVISIFAGKCKEKGSKFLPLKGNVKIDSGPILIEGEGMAQECSITGKYFKMEKLHLSMLGGHQIINASASVLAAEVLKEKGYSIGHEHVRSGLESTKIPGRIQIMNLHPLVVLDASHNYEGVRALKQVLMKVIPHDGRLILVTGYLDDKDRNEITQAWGNFPSVVIVTKPENARSRDWQGAAKYFKRFVNRVYLEKEIENAVTLGRKLSCEKDCLCVAGSFYIIKRAERQILQLLTN